MKILSYLSVLFIGCLCTSCSQPKSTTDCSTHIENERFVDADGRTIIWNGLNLVEKDPNKGYIQEDDEELFKKFRLWGINCVRYGIHWDGLEPQPGQYNETYLAEIDKRVHWAKENGIGLILDMHQDLYSRKFGNGAPLWATLDEGLPHVTGNVWSDAYLMSPAVQKSFDNFWLNTPATDGIGIQDHYIDLWKKLAERYSDSISVIGFDVMNEPFVGSKAPLILQKLLGGFAAHLASQGQPILSEADITGIWMDEKKRTEALSQLDNREVFLQILNNAKEPVNDFEENQLSEFYQKVRDAVRSTGNKKILFLEHNYFCNLGIESTFRFPLDENGEKDKLCAYAPHAYDLVVDTEGATNPGFERLNTIFEQLALSAKHRNVPTVLGEWGAFYMGNNYAQPALHHLKWIEQLLAGQTYWAWWPGIDTQDYFHLVISRPYPQCVNGELISYHYEQENNHFTCNWKETSSSAPSIIYLPDITKITKQRIQLSPTSDYRLQQLSDESKAGYIIISPKNSNRSLSITF